MPSLRLTFSHTISSITASLVAAMLMSTLWTGAAGATTPDYLDEPFEETPTTWTAGWHDAAIGSRNRISSISSGRNGSAIRVSIPSGSHFGSAAHWRFADNGRSEPEELYYRYYLRFPDGFPNHGTGKLPGPAGLYASSGRNKIKPSSSNPGWSARMFFARPDDDRNATHTQIGFYVYHLDQPSASGEFFPWDEHTGALEHGSWQCVEGRVLLNTPGQSNGVLEGWVNEKLAFHESGLRFRTSSQANIDIKSFWFDVYYGGNDPAPGSMAMDFDSLALSSERIGCGGGGRFVDTGGSVHRDTIERLAHAQITLGCNPPTNNRFCPNDPVTRGQMAAFLARALGLPVANNDYFRDDNSSTFEADINRLAVAGITGGCNPPANDAFCASDPVTRRQMAAFLRRALALPPATSDYFVDDDGSPFEADINRLAAAGVTQGCNPPANDHYCPGDVVTRGQMATFLSRALGLPAPPDVVDQGPEVPVVPSGFDAAVPAGASIQAVANSMPAGAKIYIEPGTHQRQTVRPRPNQVFTGGAGAILDGLGRTAIGFGGGGAGVTISGIHLRRYATAVDVTADGWTTSGVTISNSDYGIHTTGDSTSVIDSTITDLGLAGIKAVDSRDLLVDGTTVRRSNTVADTIYRAGIWLETTADASIDSSTVEDNYGYGIWFDDGASDTTVTGSTVASNALTGIMHDHAYRSTITFNTSSSNGTASGLSIMRGAGILVRGPGAVITDNNVTGNAAGIGVIDHTATVPSGPQGSYLPTGTVVLRNTVINSGLVGGLPTGNGSVFTSATWDDNDYRYSNPADQIFRWQGKQLDFAGWQTHGQDLAGSMAAP